MNNKDNPMRETGGTEYGDTGTVKEFSPKQGFHTRKVLAGVCAEYASYCHSNVERYHKNKYF